MSEQKRKTVYLQGYLYWVKILDAPRPNYDGDAREWTFEFEPNEDSVALLQEHGVDDRLRDRKNKKGYEEREPFIILRRGEFKADGERNEKIRVVDAANNAWNTSEKIGNRTLADVKVQIVDWGARKKKGIYPLAIRILELVPCVLNEFAPLPEDDPHYIAAKSKNDQFRKDFGLDEDENSTPDEPEENEPEQENDTQEDPLDDDVPV